MRFPLLTKLAAMAAVMVLLSLVLLRIELLVSERRARQWHAAASVEQALAGPQTLLGPLLHRACQEEWDVLSGEGKEQKRSVERRDFHVTRAPQLLQVSGELRAEPRYRGLFKVNGYSGPVQLLAHWDEADTPQPVAEHPGSRLKCGPATLMLSTSDVRGLRSAQLSLNGTPLAVQAGTGHAGFPRGLQAELPAALKGGPLDVRLQLQLQGMQSLAVVPAAGRTEFALRSDWPHPSFGGRFLPGTRNITDRGFDARWEISALASAAALDVNRGAEVCRLAAVTTPDTDPESYMAAPLQPGRNCLDTLAVAFIDPVNPYVLSDRAMKYALMFIVLTFGCVGLTEVLAGRRVHPVQYTFVGLALALFFLLLLSLSEHIAFGLAYALAAAACVALLTHYGSHMLGHWRAGLAFGTGVAGLYGALWLLLQMEQAALVIGAVLIFAFLALLMVLTRKVDWSTAFGSLGAKAAA